MRLRLIIPALFLAASAVVARAEERVTGFEADIVVSRQGEVRVTETIEIVAEGDRFRKGINRDLDLARGIGAPEILSVTLDGEAAAFSVEDHGDARRIRIGSADTPLSRGPHNIGIVYRIENGIVEDGDRDMLSWDVTGAWDVPIDSVSATIKLPTGIRIVGMDTFAGMPDRPRDDLRMKEKSGALNFSTRGGLGPGERLHVGLSFPRDAIGPADEE